MNNKIVKRITDTTKISKKCHENIDYGLAPCCEVDVGNSKKRMSAKWTIRDMEGKRINGQAINSLDSDIMSILFSFGVDIDTERTKARATGKILKDPVFTVARIMVEINPKLENSNEGAEALRVAVIKSLQKIMGRRIDLDYTDQVRERLKRTNPEGVKKLKKAVIKAPILSASEIRLDLNNGKSCTAIQIHPVDDSVCDALALYRYATDVGQLDTIPQQLLPASEDACKSEKFSLQRHALRTILQQEMVTQKRIWSRKKAQYKESFLPIDRLYKAYKQDQQIERITHPKRVRDYAATLLAKWVKNGFLEWCKYDEKTGWRYKISKSQLN